MPVTKLQEKLKFGFINGVDNVNWPPYQTKTLKLQQIIGPQITDDTTLHSHNTVITIPENLPLTDSEKSVLSKGLNFVPITKRTNEFSIKQDVEKFLRRVQLKAFFHDKEGDSDTSNKDIFETHKFANLDGLPQRDNLPL